MFFLSCLYFNLKNLICIFALTTSSYRNPQGTNFAGAACDLLLPMLSKLRFIKTSVFTL